ncbi:MAG: TVP38/TMEM64 family protein [Oscillatoria sp. PMC 1068.18]|nr:TVP38/TMEM64 family protein [Oscillatoria sp. PMC 1076.18]MEC4990592.1 TVP38/TMEM64 family protein [Oscillatoria sp. PMC 1068.18]
MSKFKNILLLFTVICILATGLGIYLLREINQEQLQTWLEAQGMWTPIVYIALYAIATLFILPSTPLNLAGGAIFGTWVGTFWTSLAAIIAALIGFAFTRTIGKELITQKLAGKWEAIDTDIRQGGLFYIFAIRLLPIIPYGLVNFAAGLTSIRFQDYFWGTIFGTIPGILPFVAIGSSGIKAIQTGNILPLLGTLACTGILVAAATWYRLRRQFPQKAIRKSKHLDSD